MPNPENEGYQRLGEGLYHLRAAAGGGGELFWGLDPRNPRKRPKFWADVTSISPNMAIFESPKIDGLGIGPLQALSGVLACRGRRRTWTCSNSRPYRHKNPRRRGEQSGSLNCSDYLALFGSVARLGRCPRKHEGLLLVLSIQTLYALADSLVGKYIVWQDVLHKR